MFFFSFLAILIGIALPIILVTENSPNFNPIIDFFIFTLIHDFPEYTKYFFLKKYLVISVFLTNVFIPSFSSKLFLEKKKGDTYGTFHTALFILLISLYLSYIYLS